MASTQAFQSQVYVSPAPAVEGDACSTNPRHSFLAGPGGLVADTGGLYIGRFAWVTYGMGDSDLAPSIATQTTGGGTVAGLVHREQQGMIIPYLQEAGMFIPGGQPVTLWESGDMWVKNNNATAACTVGLKAYAQFGTGKVLFAATSTAGTVQNTAFSIVTVTTPSATLATITNGVMTIPTGSTTAGFFYPGTILTSGGTIVSGTYVVAQLSGTAGGVGTYSLSVPQTQTSATISGSYGLLTTTGTQTGSFVPGQVVTAASDALSSGTTVMAMYPTGALTGTGALGTYVVNISQAHSTGTIVGASTYETNWIARSYGAAGELVKISKTVLG
jgi:hypothetical protein